MSMINSSTSLPSQQSTGPKNPLIHQEVQQVGGKSAVQAEMQKTGQNFKDALQTLLSGGDQQQSATPTATTGNNLNVTA